MAKLKKFRMPVTEQSISYLVNLLSTHRETDPELTGNYVRELLEEHGISQSRMAREIGISDRTIRRYISGNLVLPVLVIWALAAAIPFFAGTEEK